MDLRRVGLITGPLLFLIIVLLPTPPGMPREAQFTAGITLWIAAWWILEPVNSAVTSLLPIVLFPLCGVMSLKSLSGEYANQIIFLFMAGFFLGKTIEKWELHRRIALNMVSWMGSNPSGMVLGFMTATAVISMWISNTATAVMMTPVAIAVSKNAMRQEGMNENFSKTLMLGVGYACSIGGLATIIGTPTNAIFLGFAQAELGATISFWKWFLVGFPITVVLLILCWIMLVKMFPLPKSFSTGHASHAGIREEIEALGPVSTAERRLMIVFGAVIFCWITGSAIWYKWVPNSDDTVVAMMGAILLFIIPAGNPNGADSNQAEKRAEAHVPLLDWQTALKIPWGILLLFGGGLALAKGFDNSGLAIWIGHQLEGLASLPGIVILLCVLIVVVLLSEVASNIATASMMMPVLATIAVTIGSDPLGLCMSATLAASIGFALPVATAPNSIVYASGYLQVKDMARAGIVLDVICVLVILVSIYTLLPMVWGLNV